MREAEVKRPERKSPERIRPKEKESEGKDQKGKSWKRKEHRGKKRGKLLQEAIEMEEKSMKMKCSVIQDLLPSYVDNICSEDTRELVQEHVAECEQCKKKLDQMRNTEIVAEKAAKKQVDYLKKIRRTITQKEGLGMIILVILVGIAYVGLFVRGGGLLNYSRIPDYSRMPSVIFTVLIFCAAALAENYRFSSGRKAAAAAEIGISGAVFAFALVVDNYWVRTLAEYHLKQSGRVPFPFNIMEPYEFGPFYANVLRAVALIPVAVLLKNTFGKQKNAYATVLNITAISYIVYANEWLYHMDGPEMAIQRINELTIIQIVLAAVGIIICALLQKFGKTSEGAESLCDGKI